MGENDETLPTKPTSHTNFVIPHLKMFMEILDEVSSGGGRAKCDIMSSNKGRKRCRCARQNKFRMLTFPNNMTITQLLIMTMETSEEVSTGQELKGKSGIIDIKEMEGAIWACASIQAQNAHFVGAHDVPFCCTPPELTSSSISMYIFKCGMTKFV